MKEVFIIGARGYHEKYGGWETFVSNLVDNYHDKETNFHISSTSIYNEKLLNNVHVDYIKTKATGAKKMFIHTVKSFKYYIKYIKDNNIHNAYIYILGLKLGPYLWLYKRTLKKLGITVIVNPDGFEYKRKKWNFIIKFCFICSEWLMLKNCDIIVCDAKAIKKYVDNKYGRNNTKYIAYGINYIDFSKIDEKNILDKYKLKKDDYLLLVGRCVPENNLELIINEFKKIDLKKKLLIITNLSSSNYYNVLKKNTNFDLDKRIKFIDGVYDQDELAVIRKNAYLYIHGHSVGGTNPSLLEALSLTNLNILYDVCYNKDVGQDACLYFSETMALSKVLKSINQINRHDLGLKAKKIIEKNYTWDIIVREYKKIFK